MTALQKSLCYCTNLRQSAAAISDFYNEELEKTGLTVSQYRLLINLRRLENANITHWAEAVGLDRSTMVRNIKPLETSGFVTRTDGHGKTFTLSDTGNRVLDAAIPLWNTAQRKIEAFLGDADCEAILRISGKLQGMKERKDHDKEKAI